MLDRPDKFFVQPRQVLAARKVDVFDAINLVLYAKIPLVSARRGWDLIAGFVSLDNSGAPRSVLSKMDMRGLLEKYAQVIKKLTYPVAPLQYEAVLWEIAEAKESMLPYFYHEHHFVVDRKRRAELFLKLYTELRKLVENEKIILQISDSERTSMLAAHAWMTADTLRGYLRANGVEPWWSEEENIQSHGKLERILLSDGLKYERPEAIGIDYDQLPSYLFAAMLLKRGSNPFRPATQEVWSMPIVPAFPAEQVTNSTPVEVAPPGGSSSREMPETLAVPFRQEPKRVALPKDDDPEAEAPRKGGAASHAPSMTKQEVADFLKVAKNTVDNYRKLPGFPAHSALANNDKGAVRVGC